MNERERIKVFIGSGEASLLERKVAIYSLRKHTKRDLNIYVFNGTHNSIELNDREPFLAPLPLKLKYQNITEFSLYRYLIPEICEYRGKAIYIDSDVICLTDIGRLFDTPLNGCDFLAKGDAYNNRGEKLWALSVMLIDCQKSRFDLETFYREIAMGLYSDRDLACMSSAFLTHHPYKIGNLDPNWNVFDRADSDTNLIHYTNLYTQPWKYPNHRYGQLWFDYFREAIDSGFVTPKDIQLSKIRSYVRPNIMQGNSPSRLKTKYIKMPIDFAKRVSQKIAQNSSFNF
jgi:lipopolysaccharide biosynthesis glycosyltransferase